MKFGLDPINYANGFKAALWGSCIGHLKKSKEAWKTGQGWKARFFGHLGIAASQALPVIGQIAALIELAIFKNNSSKSSSPLKGKGNTNPQGNVAGVASVAVTSLPNSSLRNETQPSASPQLKEHPQSQESRIPREVKNELDSLGIPWSYASEFPKISDEKRLRVRDATAAEVGKIEGKPINPDWQAKVVLYESPHSQFNNGALLGSGDVLQVPCKMDYDENFNKEENNKEFLMHHAAAINIGESENCDDFATCCADGTNQLDEKKYLEKMGAIAKNILESQVKAGVERAVWFPFGMGAFLRNLGKNDPAYNDVIKLNNLRDQIADVFIKEYTAILKSDPKLNIDICLPRDQKNIQSESVYNYNAFIKALQQLPEEYKSRITVHVNKDATSVAQAYANEGKSVSLTNGANKKRIGNHWYGHGAKTAIDENIHRRSSTAAYVSAKLNGYQDLKHFGHKTVPTGTLKDNIDLFKKGLPVNKQGLNVQAQTSLPADLSSFTEENRNLYNFFSTELNKHIEINKKYFSKGRDKKIRDLLYSALKENKPYGFVDEVKKMRTSKPGISTMTSRQIIFLFNIVQSTLRQAENMVGWHGKQHEEYSSLERSYITLSSRPGPQSLMNFMLGISSKIEDGSIGTEFENFLGNVDPNESDFIKLQPIAQKYPEPYKIFTESLKYHGILHNGTIPQLLVSLQKVKDGLNFGRELLLYFYGDS